LSPHQNVSRKQIERVARVVKATTMYSAILNLGIVAGMMVKYSARMQNFGKKIPVS
jgi:hypothetical protein